MNGAAPPRILAFADESMERAYILAVFETPLNQYHRAQKLLRSLAKDIGRPALHFHSLRPTERIAILERLTDQFPNSVTLHISTLKKTPHARKQTIQSAVADLCSRDVTRLTFDRDRTTERADRAAVHEKLSTIRRMGAFEYLHEDKVREPCLWIADAAAWCWQRGGREKQLAMRLIAKIYDAY